MDYSKAESSQLWSHLSPRSNVRHLSAILQELVYRLSKAQPHGRHLVANSVHIIAGILADASLPADTLCLACVLLGLVCNVADFREIVARTGILKHLLDVIDIRLGKGVLSSLEVELLEKVTGLLLYFSKADGPGPRACLKKLLSDNAPGLLLKLCQDSDAMFFMSNDSKIALEGMCLASGGRYLIGDTQQMSEEALNNAYSLYVGEAHQHRCLNRFGYVVTLYDTTDPEHDIVINEEMVKSNTVSRISVDDKSTMLPAGGSGDQSENFQNIMVTSVVNGAFFWAQVGLGGTAPDTVQSVQTVLEEWPEYKKQYVVHQPKSSHFVCGKKEGIGLFRAQVLAAEGDDYVSLLAFDYGVFMKFPWRGLFYLTPEMNLKDHKPQAVLCKLCGVGPVPRNHYVVVNALYTLCNLVTIDSKGICFERCNVVQSLQHLCRCPCVNVQMAICRLYSNLARSDILRSHINQTQVIPDILDLCQKASVLSADQEIRDMITAALTALSNILFNSPENKAKFINWKGLSCC